jgi:hypothetical protein
VSESRPEPAVRGDGPTYELPDADERQSRLSRVSRVAEYHRSAGREVVVVQSLGRVGTAHCLAAAIARREDGSPRYLAIGLDLPRAASYWKVARLDQGLSPYPDVGSPAATRRAALDDYNLLATIEAEVIGLADFVVVALGEPSAGDWSESVGAWHPRLDGLVPAIHAVGRWMRPDSLVVLVEPLSVETREQALGLLAHERERRGIDAVLRVGWLAAGAVAGLDEESAALTRSFLDTFALERPG